MMMSFIRWRSHHIWWDEIAGNGRTIYFEIAVLPSHWPRSVIRINLQYCSSSLIRSLSKQQLNKKWQSDWTFAKKQRGFIKRNTSLKSETLMKRLRVSRQLKMRIRRAVIDGRARVHIRAENGGDKDSYLLLRHDQSRWWIRLITFSARHAIPYFLCFRWLALST